MMIYSKCARTGEDNLMKRQTAGPVSTKPVLTGPGHSRIIQSDTIPIRKGSCRYIPWQVRSGTIRPFKTNITGYMKIWCR